MLPSDLAEGTAIPATMAAAVMPRPEEIAVETVPVPAVGAQDVLIKVQAVGICGTDLHIFHGRHRNAVFPLIAGHELAGEVAAVGSEAGDVALGTRVVAEGRAGTGTRRPGAYAEYVSVPREMLHVIPPTAEPSEAALVDPLACAVNAVNQAQLSPGDRVVVIGQGSSGLCIVQAARALAGCEVAAVDHHDERLALSSRFGAAHAVNPKTTDVAGVIAKWTGGRGADCVIEATGRESGIDLALRIVRRAGRVVIYGVSGQPVQVAVDQIMFGQLVVIGACGSPGCYPSAIQLLAEGKVDLRSIISRTMPLAELPAAFRLLEQHREVVKVVIVP